MWKYYAIISAVFAALTTVFAKIGIKDINSNYATAIRTTIVVLLTWGIVWATVPSKEIKSIGKTTFLFLALSAVSTGLSWIFYFKALQIGDASKVALLDKMSVILTVVLSIVILKEPSSLKVILGTMLVTAGLIFIVLDK